MGSSLPEVDGGKVLSDAWDYKGRPAVRSSTGGWASASTILGLFHILLFFLTSPTLLCFCCRTEPLFFFEKWWS